MAARLPPCVRERAGFMRPTRVRSTTSSCIPTRISPTMRAGQATLLSPPYTAPGIPFRWMRREHAEGIAEEDGLDHRPDLEALADEQMPFESGWVQHGYNQRRLLDDFFAHVELGSSLCFFYPKRVPLTDEEGKVLIGAGRVLDVRRQCGVPAPGGNPLETIAWERMVRALVRPGFEDGFLLPYHEILEAAEEDEQLDTREIVAFAPDDVWDEFSYATEHVSHDSAISVLTACEAALHRVSKVLTGTRTCELQWMSNRVGELWRLRGPCPGLGSALEAFGMGKGTLVVRKVAHLLAENEDPWELMKQSVHRSRVRPHWIGTTSRRAFPTNGRCSMTSGGRSSSCSPAFPAEPGPSEALLPAR